MTDALDLEVALRTIHQLGLADGDIGYEYWHQVAQLLKSAAEMKVQLEKLGQSDLAGSEAVQVAKKAARPYRPALRLTASLEEADAWLDQLGELVAKHDLEVVLQRPDGLGVGLVNPERLEHYKALEEHATCAEHAGDSATGPLEEIRETAAANEATELCISADYYVLDSTVSPRQTLERFRIECELPVGDEKFDVDIRVGDEQSQETYLAVWSDFSWGSMTLSEVILRGFFYARFGTQECPSVESYPDAFDEVVLSIQERTASVFSEPLLLLSALHRHGSWTLNWLKAYIEEGGRVWAPTAADGALHPLRLVWDAALVVDGRTDSVT